MAKDPKRQLLGKIARQKGQYFEQRLDSTFDYYRERGYALIEKTPEPMKVIKPEGNGRFLLAVWLHRRFVCGFFCEDFFGSLLQDRLFCG